MREILGGGGAVANQGATPETRGYNPNIPPYPYDPARAKALLAEAGYPNGFKIAADVLTNLIMADASIYQKAADDLARIGVKLDLRATTFANWARRFTSGEWQDADAFSLVWSSAPFQDAIRPIEQYSCAKVAAFACDPAIMPLIAGSNREMNPVARQQKLQEILARLHDTAPALLLVNMETIVVASPKITDIHTRIMGIEYERVRFEP